MYVLPASKKCRASWPIKFIKGTRPGLKRSAQVTVQQMQKKDLNVKRLEWIFNAKWCEGRPWLKSDRDENVMTCTICTKYGKRGETGNLKKKLAMEVEHEIEREFI